MGQKEFNLLFIVACGFFYGLNTVKALGDYKCKGLDVKRSETHAENIKVCAETIKLTSMEDMTMEKMGCFNKCFKEMEGLVDQDGKPHKENIANIIDSTMPEALRTAIKEKTEACLDKHGGKLDPKKTSCASYGPLTMCTHKALMEICT